ncbi:MAG: AlkZ family DNA glycosylase [Alphaproteobacteria bacterium]|nr:AlkZ family DNA glycosylase [Alphaproteobacteria bacterium]
MEGKSALELSLDHVRAFRLDRQHLLAPAADAVAAASRLLGAQAQVHSAGVLQLRARCPGVTSAAVRAQLFDTRDLVKMWTQRGTLHIVAARDLPAILALRDARMPARLSQFAAQGVPAKKFRRVCDAIARAIGDAHLSRRQIADLVCPEVGEWAREWVEQSWGSLLKSVSEPGYLCHGPTNATMGTFRRLDRWVPVDRQEVETGLAAFLDRYLEAFGPATEQDFAKFAGLPVTEARALFQRERRRLVRVAFAGREAWARAADSDALRRAAMPDDRLIVLPAFDPYLLAHADTRQFVAEKYRKLVSRQSGWISPVILRRGEVAGVWFHRERAAGPEILVRPFGRAEKGLKRRVTDAALGLLAGLDREDRREDAAAPEPT